MSHPPSHHPSVANNAKIRVLVIDDEENIRKTLRMCLEGAGYAVTLASSGEAGVAAARKQPPDVVLVDLRLGGIDGLQVTRTLVGEAPTAAIVLMTAYATIDNAVDSMRAGASDYLAKPFTPAQVLHAVGKLVKQARVEQTLAELERDRRGVPELVSQSVAFRDTLTAAERAAVTDATVLVFGETGTGKGVLARHIHARSPRASRPFVTLNCAAVAAPLVEAELFGARGVEGTPRVGLVEAAKNGTLFIDEVGDFPKELQGKLLRLLEEREFVRVGESEPRKSEARIITATHRDLKAAVGAGELREDLYYRLNVVSLRVPPLRERREDVGKLAESMLISLAEQHRRAPMTLGEPALAALGAYNWPGNVRELGNVLERAVILAGGRTITPDLLPEEVRGSVASRLRNMQDDGDESLEAAEKRHIAAVLTRHATLDSAARALGIDPSTLYRKRERYGLR